MRPTILLFVAMIIPFSFLRADPISVGMDAPMVTAKNQDGEDIAFADIYRKGVTLVYFYPKAETPGCTAEACSLRDAYEGLHARGLQILGVSKDTAVDQKKFQQNRNLPFTLIADTDGKVASAFGVPSYPVVGLTRRQSFIVKDGKIAWSSLSAKTGEAASEVQNALDTLR